MIKTDNESSLGIEKVTYGGPRTIEPHEPFYVSVKLPTYSSPKPTLTLSSYLGQNVGLGRGRWAVSQKRKMTPNLYTTKSSV